MVDENLTPDERAAVIKLPRDTIAADPYPLSPRNLETGIAQIGDDAMGQAVTFLGYEWTDLT